jgi:hypothetical protein
MPKNLKTKKDNPKKNKDEDKNKKKDEDKNKNKNENEKDNEILNLFRKISDGQSSIDIAGLMSCLGIIKWDSKYTSEIFNKINILENGFISKEEFEQAVLSPTPIDLIDGKTFKDFYDEALSWSKIKKNVD